MAGELRDLVRALNLDARVTLVGQIDATQLVGHLARCRAVCFPAQDEDYGFVTVEAFASRKPVITCTDSGGPSELVHDGGEGLLCAPTSCRRRGAGVPDGRGGLGSDLGDDLAAGRGTVGDGLMPYRSPLETRIARKTTRAVSDFKMIEEGDRILTPFCSAL